MLQLLPALATIDFLSWYTNVQFFFLTPPHLLSQIRCMIEFGVFEALCSSLDVLYVVGDIKLIQANLDAISNMLAVSHEDKVHVSLSCWFHVGTGIM